MGADSLARSIRSRRRSVAGADLARPGVGWRPPMSTRKLIIAALVCGLAVLVASALQLFLATR